MKKDTIGDVAEPKPKQVYAKITDELHAELVSALGYYSLTGSNLVLHAIKAIIAAHKKQAKLIFPLEWAEGMPMPHIIPIEKAQEMLGPPEQPKDE